MGVTVTIDASRIPAEGQVFILAAPRSGGSLVLAALLGDSRWSVSGLSGSDPLGSISQDGSGSHRLRAADVDERMALALREAGEIDGSSVDWSPRWSLRAGALAAAFPEARFVVVLRDPRLAMLSSLRAWATGQFAVETELSGWWGEQWSFPVTEDWKSLVGRPLAHVAAAQWLGISAAIREDLEGLDRGRWSVTSYERLVGEPGQEMRRVAGELGLDWHADLPDALPLSASRVTEPGRVPGDGELHELSIALQNLAGELETCTAFAETHGCTGYRDPIAAAAPEAGPVTRPSAGTPFRSGHSSSFAGLLEQSGSSVVITTYKSGHLIVGRARDGVLDTAFTSLGRPMGVAVAPGRLAVGTLDSVVSYLDHPGLRARVEGEAAHDAVFVPRSVLFTGDVAIHEMAYDANGRLWFVNTRFSCLATLDLDSSFTPQWRPSWITGLAAEDRCHLNGMAMAGGAPRYVSALAQTDTPNGWRERKGTAGVVVDIASGEVVAGGLAMPHSPRWHDGRLWILESGNGTLATIDPATGHRTTVATLPGFTRGLAFIGRYALVGLSQVRESVFTGLPVTATATERNAGVWVVDTDTGDTVGLLRFDGVVQEIFDVQVLHGMTWPVVTEPGEHTQAAFSLSPDTIAQLAHPSEVIAPPEPRTRNQGASAA
jgi:uncharacterized protein (TIGR03032 family)